MIEERSRSSQDSPSRLCQDLAVLADGPGVLFHLSFDRGLLALWSHGRRVWRVESGSAWSRAQGAARAEMILRWIHDAADHYRALKEKERRKDEGAA